ncbi:MAG: hypothetical protein K8R25_05415 [Methanosarcinales archaeon]|nr:hypothetical protein [Methanosarcinales archaeon]
MAKKRTKQQDEENLYVGDEYAEEEELTEDENELEGLYDLVIPPGVPESIIVELVEEFDLEPVNRLSNVDIVEIDQRELLALRGELDIVNDAHDYMMKRLHELQEEFKSPWVNVDD